MSSAESDVLTESVTEDSADDCQITKMRPVKRAKKVLERLKSRTGRKIVTQSVIRSKTNAVVASSARVARPNENGQGDCAASGGGKPDTTYVTRGLDLNGLEI